MSGPICCTASFGGLKPRRIVELGSGHSTLFMAAAAERNRAEGVVTELRTFDPFPTVAQAGLPGLTALERIRAQDVPLEVFTGLEAGDPHVDVLAATYALCRERPDAMARLVPTW